MTQLRTGMSFPPKDTYDLLLVAGGMAEGHIPVSGLDDLVRVAKNGKETSWEVS